MPWLLARVAHGHLFYVGPDVEASHVVGVVEVVAEIVFGEVEWDEEACVVGGEFMCANEGDCEFGTGAMESV